MKTARISVIICSFFLVASALFAQAGALAPAQRAAGPYVVRFTSNVSGAPVYIDGRYANTMDFSIRLSAGAHDIRVTAPGYPDWTRRILVNGNMTVRAEFQRGGQQPIDTQPQRAQPQRPQSYSLHINANVNGAQIYVDGSLVQNGTPDRITLPPGRHSIRVTKDGYDEWQRDVDVNGDSTINIDLSMHNYVLRVHSNVNGAQVTIGHANGAQVSTGRIPYEMKVPRGLYVVTVFAPGYLPFTTTVTVQGNQVVQAILQPSNATVQLALPDQYRNPYVNNPYNSIEWYVDGQRIRGNDARSIQVTPGMHSIRIVSGGLAIEGRYNFQPGQTYRLVPMLQLNIGQ